MYMYVSSFGNLIYQESAAWVGGIGALREAVEHRVVAPVEGVPEASTYPKAPNSPKVGPASAR